MRRRPRLIVFALCVQLAADPKAPLARLTRFSVAPSAQKTARSPLVFLYATASAFTVAPAVKISVSAPNDEPWLVLSR